MFHAVDSAPDEQPIPISIVSNSSILREGLAKLLSECLDIQLIGIYTSEIECGDHLPNPGGHMVLLDSGVGLEQAVTWTHFWRRRTVPASVIVLELVNSIEVILRCIEAGACGYSLQGAPIDEVAAVMRRARQGKVTCSPEVTAHLFARLEERSKVSEPLMTTGIPLTPRELEGLDHIAARMSNREIASHLFIAVHTVKHHIHSILTKLELDHRREAARVAIRQGWIRDHHSERRL